MKHSIDSIARILQALFDTEDDAMDVLDEAVYECKVAEATAINNEGIDEQLKYLVQCLALDDVYERLINSADRDKVVNCTLCHQRVPAETAHLHQNQWIGDECCWGKHLRGFE